MPCLTDDEILAVAKLARRAEKHYRCPQDVEWALEPSGDVLLLQSRPETVWSRRPRPAASCTADPITSMVQTLLNPVHSIAGRPRPRLTLNLALTRITRRPTVADGTLSSQEEHHGRPVP